MKQIQWFPGHMQKTRRQIEEKLPIIDIVYEILDARIPESSRNPMLSEIIRNKPRLVILNKSDLADEVETRRWLERYIEKGYHSIAINSLTGNAYQTVIRETDIILSDLKAKEAAKGMQARAYRAMVIGIPNVGKSQFINSMAGKNKVKTGNIPGVTKSQSFIRTKGDVLLLDNPGVLWPKFEDEHTAKTLALTGSIKDEILPLDDVAMYGIRFLQEHYPERLKERYNVIEPAAMTPLEILDHIGKVRGCLLSGGAIDYDRAIRLFLYDIRNNKLGRLTFETVHEFEI